MKVTVHQGRKSNEDKLTGCFCVALVLLALALVSPVSCEVSIDSKPSEEEASQ